MYRSPPTSASIHSVTVDSRAVSMNKQANCNTNHCLLYGQYDIRIPSNITGITGITTITGITPITHVTDITARLQRLLTLMVKPHPTLMV